MKVNFIGLILIGLFSFSQSFAQKYEKFMGETLAAMGKAQTPTDIQAVAQSFERIAEAEPSQWLPKYYSALCYTMATFSMKDDKEKDALITIAEGLLDKAIAQKENESELGALQAYVIMAKVAVSPISRGMLLSGDFFSTIEQAKALNPENPRIHLIEGTYTMNMPAMFGGGKKNACEKLKLSEEKFAIFIPVDSLHPNWGKEMLKEFLAKCNEK